VKPEHLAAGRLARALVPIVGHATGHTGEGIAIGAAAGLLTGAVVGNAQDSQREELDEQDERLRRQEEEIARQRRELREMRGESVESEPLPEPDRRDDSRREGDDYSHGKDSFTY
jgi:flavin-dependent dehydrogenase